GDDRAAFRLLLACPTGLSASEVSVVFDAAYDRIPHPDGTLEDSVSEVWDRRLKKNPTLFNGMKFRYCGCSLIRGAEFHQKTNVCLHLGLTDYRTFVGTNLNPLWEKFLVPSTDDRRRCQHTSNPLGNGAIVETSDHRIVLLRRSNNVGEFPGHYVFPGGHPEPQEISITGHQTADGDQARQLLNDAVSREMFGSIAREVVEEIGVPPAELSEAVFMGISERALNVRPTAFFFMKCSLESEGIQRVYRTAQDGYESTQLFTMSVGDVEDVVHEMPGCHQGGFALYKLLMN
ncbi:hypothetical protein M569_11911, partial [Genlisea aurea]